jgi:hypothetical protein
MSLAGVARLLPDEPRFVEVRSMLLHGRARLVGPVTATPPAFVVVHADGDQAAVIGHPLGRTIASVAMSIGEVLVLPEDRDWVSASLPTWNIEIANLYSLPRDAPTFPPRVPRGTKDVRFLARNELALLTDLPSTLAEELHRAHAEGTPIAASFEDARPAAFCYAGSTTETLWDVSIDTLDRYRRRGHAASAVAFLIQHYAGQGKRPVWGALVSNGASIALASHLGFEPGGSLCIFTRPPANVRKGA